MACCPICKKELRGADLDLGELDLAACIWVSLADDRAAARRVLAQKIAYYGHALGPLIWDRLGLVKEDFAPIEQAMMVERDEEKAIRAWWTNGCCGSASSATPGM